MDRGVSAEDGSIRLPVDELRRLSESYGSATIFEPQSGIENRDSGNGDFLFSNITSSACTGEETHSLLLFALQFLRRQLLAWEPSGLYGQQWFFLEGLEYAAGAMSLNGNIKPPGQLLMLGSKEEAKSDMDKFRCSYSTLCSMGFSFKKCQQGSLLLQLASASACVVLSLMKLIKHNYGEIEEGDTDKRNLKAALNIFYSLALAEALLFLMEKAYWEWKVSYCKLLEEVRKECDLELSGSVSIRRFLYDAYSMCVEGSIFDGLKMDMVTFAMDLLASNSADEQLIGARVLCQFTMNPRFSDDTLQKIGTNISVIERLVEILNWKDPQEEEIRRSAAEMLSKLAGKKQNSLRVAGIPGALESISSLLQTNRTFSTTADEIGEKTIFRDHAHYGFWTFNQLGLLILKKLARDHDNCGKIGNTRGLLPKIIDFTHAEERLLKDENVTPSQILTVKSSLQLVKMLASTIGTTGNHLRREISEMVFTVSNIRDILRHGEKHPMLQKLGIEILTSLALEEDATERIGGAGGVLKELFNIFFSQRIPENQNHVRIASGEALAMLALESRRNCLRILKLRVLERLVGALEVPLLRVNAARILRNLCTYSGADCFDQLKGITAAVPTVLNAVMSEENKLQEVMVGLAAEAFKFMTSQESNTMFNGAGIKEAELANKILQILKRYQNPSVKVPRIRRFSIELAIWMMQNNAANVRTFKDLGLEKELEWVLESTAEVENFNIFSGTFGLSRHSTTIHSLVETAMQLLEDR
ncbi:hypothetical protein NC652_022094 [Populus alba x Populus x berolinensis]|nr:hypothetical protein NC652_022094 [Populus alba x Populus x berolinensis]